MAEKLLTIFFEEFSKFGLVHFVISLLKYGQIFKIKILDPQFFVFSSNFHQFVSIGGWEVRTPDFGLGARGSNLGQSSNFFHIFAFWLVRIGRK